jgi:hypothetical protein
MGTASMLQYDEKTRERKSYDTVDTGAQQHDPVEEVDKHSEANEDGRTDQYDGKKRSMACHRTRCQSSLSKFS